MLSNKELKENLEAVSAIKDITRVYQEISSLRMNQLKDGVSKTREFLDGIAEVYNHAKSAYVATLQRQLISRKLDWKALSFVRRNAKTILVFLSANEHLYGSLILNVWDKFIADFKKSNADAAVVGAFGKYLMKNEEERKGIFYFDLDDDKPKALQVNKIISHISKYEQIIVYYGQLVSILNQLPAKSQITGGVDVEKPALAAKNYLFEPSPQKILEFFETEIIDALFSQKVFEHQLARFAARMVAMDQATENANLALNKLDREYKGFRRKSLNKKQLEVFAGFELWQREEQ